MTTFIVLSCLVLVAIYFIYSIKPVNPEILEIEKALKSRGYDLLDTKPTKLTQGSVFEIKDPPPIKAKTLAQVM